ncbi:MAG: class I SAM-dependent methyltransferase [Candidatus Jordarchaeum sp.]|uniref:class I SAM-dependent methyltransferase n=1 Tax=Candidatus Jordarchaeum sp. TaxID=2823881 RepID=UPI00404B79E9
MGSAENIPLPDESVDVIVTLDSLYEWKNLGKSIREIHRILKRQGLLVGRDSNKEAPNWRIKLNFISFDLPLERG